MPNSPRLESQKNLNRWPYQTARLVVHARSEDDASKAECGNPRATRFKGDITCKFCLARRGLYYLIPSDYFA
jgi:hypothetical protein